MLVVDPLTGSMGNIEPNKVDRTLTASQAALLKNHEGCLVVLASTVTLADRAHLFKVN